MRHIKLIITIAAAAFVAVFVVRHLMWMKGLEKGPEVKRVNDSSVSQTVRDSTREEEKNQEHGGGAERPVIHEEETAVVRKEGPPAERPGTGWRQREPSAQAKPAEEARSLQKGTEIIYEKDAGKMIDNPGRRKGEENKQNENKGPGSGKTSTITSRNSTVSITHKNSSPPLPEAGPVIEDDMISIPHPTSTVPQ